MIVSNLIVLIVIAVLVAAGLVGQCLRSKRSSVETKIDQAIALANSSRDGVPLTGPELAAIVQLEYTYRFVTPYQRERAE